MKQHIASTVNDNIQHRMRIYIQPDVVQCLPSFRLAAGLALPAHPPTHRQCPARRRFIYIYTQSDLRFRQISFAIFERIQQSAGCKEALWKT